MNTIAIIIPIYNSEKTIERCIDSILSQSFDDFKVICINDGSTDNSLNILKKYKDERIIILSQTNKGPSAARNAGLDFVFEQNFDYITFIDSDDYIDKEYLNTLLMMLKNNDVDIVCSSFFFSKNNSDKAFNQIKQDTKFTRIEATKTLLEDRTIQSHSHCKLYKKEMWNKIRFPIDIISMEDQATIYKTFLNAEYIFISNYAGYHYVQDGESICRSKITNKKVLDSLNGYLESIKDTKLPKECFLSAIQGYCNCYLMMYPRFNNKCDKAEKNEFKKIIRYTNKARLIKQFHPITKKEAIKKITYLIARPFYKILFNLFK